MEANNISAVSSTSAIKPSAWRACATHASKATQPKLQYNHTTIHTTYCNSYSKQQRKKPTGWVQKVLPVISDADHEFGIRMTNESNDSTNELKIWILLILISYSWILTTHSQVHPCSQTSQTKTKLNLKRTDEMNERNSFPFVIYVRSWLHHSERIFWTWPCKERKETWANRQNCASPVSVILSFVAICKIIQNRFLTSQCLLLCKYEIFCSVFIYLWVFKAQKFLSYNFIVNWTWRFQ